MEEKKMGIFPAILIGILILAIGIGAGLGISQLIVGNKAKEQEKFEAQEIVKQEEKSQKVNKDVEQEKVTAVVNTNENVVSNTIINNTQKFDETKSISLDGKKYEIAYDHKIYTENYTTKDGETYSYEAVSFTIYLNGKAIKTINDAPYVKENNYSGLIEINAISDAYKTNKKYIVVTFTLPADVSEDKYLIIIDQNENVVGTLLGFLRNDGVVTGDNKVNNNSQIQINDDSITLFERVRSEEKALERYIAAKYIVKVRDGIIWKNIEKIYSDSEVELAGR